MAIHVRTPTNIILPIADRELSDETDQTKAKLEGAMGKDILSSFWPETAEYGPGSFYPGTWHQPYCCDTRDPLTVINTLIHVFLHAPWKYPLLFRLI